MTSEELIDRSFGHFIQEVRRALGKTVHQVEWKTRQVVRAKRIQGLERGCVRRSVLRFEVEALADAYGIDRGELMRIAANGV